MSPCSILLDAIPLGIVSSCGIAPGSPCFGYAIAMQALITTMHIDLSGQVQIGVYIPTWKGTYNRGRSTTAFYSGGPPDTPAFYRREPLRFHFPDTLGRQLGPLYLLEQPRVDRVSSTYWPMPCAVASCPYGKAYYPGKL